MTVYFVRIRNTIKVGHAVDVSRRVATLQTACPDDLDLLATIDAGADVECRLHCALAAHRIRGEWFHLRPTLELLDDRDDVLWRRCGRHHGPCRCVLDGLLQGFEMQYCERCCLPLPPDVSFCHDLCGVELARVWMRDERAAWLAGRSE